MGTDEAGGECLEPKFKDVQFLPDDDVDDDAGEEVTS